MTGVEEKIYKIAVSRFLGSDNAFNRAIDKAKEEFEKIISVRQLDAVFVGDNPAASEMIYTFKAEGFLKTNSVADSASRTA